MEHVKQQKKTMAEVKKGLRNPLDEAQVRMAVLALQALVEDKKKALPKQPLVSSVEYVSAVITRRLVPAKSHVKPIQIVIPHSLRGGENDAEMCLIVKNGDKARIKAALAADPVPGLVKVLDLKKLQKNFSRFEDKRALAGAYDLFLADDRILSYLPEAIGTKFFVKKKQPVAVRVSRTNVSHGIRAIYRHTQMVVTTGVCTNVKVAHLGMQVEEIVENILVAMDNCAARIPKTWNGIQSISIKTSDSVALPIFNALAPLAKLPPMTKAQALAKRKLADVDASTGGRAMKKAKNEVVAVALAAPVKKTDGKKKKTTVVAKKEETKKEAAPAKKEVKKATPAQAKKETKKEAKKEVAPAAKAPVSTKKETKKATKEAVVPTPTASGAKKETKKAPAAIAKKEPKKVPAAAAVPATTARKAKKKKANAAA